MQKDDDRHVSPVVIAIMGMTGTGKSSFVHLLTKDDTINIGHGPTSETSTIRTAQFIDQKTGRAVILMDTPGFDDSRETITDMDVLEMISRTFGAEGCPRQKINGFIYMHRISDPRVGGASLKNLRMFRALCEDENLTNVRIVTTNWGRVSEQEGKNQEKALANETFKPLLDGGAKMLRHDSTLVSAEKIISEFIPLPPISTQLERELKAGMKFNETSAGAVLTEEVTRMCEKHAEELADLQREMEEAEKSNDQAWKEELEQEHREIKRMMEKADGDRRRLEMTLARVQLEACSQPVKGRVVARTQSDSASLKSAWRGGAGLIPEEIKRLEIEHGGERVSLVQKTYSRDVQRSERDWRVRQDTVSSSNTAARNSDRNCPTGCILM